MQLKYLKSFYLPIFLAVFAVGAWLSVGVSTVQAAALAPTSTVYEDTNTDGSIDNIKISFTDVTACTYEAGDWAIGVAGTVTVATITGISNSASCTTDEHIDLTVTAAASLTGGATGPRIDYTDSGTAGSVVADGNQDAANFTATDGAAPYLVSATYSDSDSSGEVDRIVLVFSEATTFTYAAADWAFTTPGDVTLGGDFDAACSGSTTTTITCTDTDNSGLTSGTNKTGKQTAAGSEPVWAYTNNSGKVTDGTTHTAAFSKTLVDGAAPILVSSDPTDGYAGYSRSGNITLTFSEYMKSSTINSTNITGLPNMGLPNFSLDANNVVATMDPTITLASGTAYTVTLSTSVTDNASTPNAMAEAHFHFTSASGESSSTGSTGQTTTSSTPTVTISDPTDDEEVAAGAVVPLAWAIGGLGVDTVGVFYSIDDGETYSQIAYNLDDAVVSYNWTVSSTLSGEVVVKVSAYDAGKAVLANDTVNISVTAVSSDEETDTEETDDEGETTETTTIDEEGRVVAGSSGSSGPSPVTGETEEISSVATGWYVRSYSFNTVYYIDASGRHPLWDTNTFFSYVDSFDEIVWVTDATLPTMTLAAPILPQAGSVLIKIQSDPKVYAIDSDNTLRWVPDEASAITLYGADWADYVIDLEPTTFARFSVGDDMTTSDTVDLDAMKTRLELAELAQ